MWVGAGIARASWSERERGAAREDRQEVAVGPDAHEDEVEDRDAGRTLGSASRASPA